MMNPAVSVVVPTSGRPEMVDRLLASVRRVASGDGVEVEILVVDSSLPGDRECLVRSCRRYNAELVDGPASVSAKRNAGAQHARTPIVLFLDSDCQMDEGCLHWHLDTLSDKGVAASLGSLVFAGERSLWFRAVEASGILAAFQPPDTVALCWGPTANLAVRREAVLEAGFDQELGPPACGGEDVDFGLRLTSAGHRIVGTSDARAFHSTDTWNRPMDLARRFLSWGRADARLVRRFPDRAYVDLPSPVLASIVLAAFTIAASLGTPVRLFAVPAALLAGTLALILRRPRGADPIASRLAPLVFVCLDLGRTIESVRRGWGGSLVRRLRFREGEAEDEWPDLVATARAEILAYLVALAVLWGLS